MADWYLDNAATGTHTGMSWANAWPSFAALDTDKASINAGDTVYISGGTGSKTYTGAAEISKDGGGIGSEIIFRPGKYSPSPSGHDGTVIFDGQGTNDNRLLTIYGDYLILDEFTFQGMIFGSAGAPYYGGRNIQLNGCVGTILRKLIINNQHSYGIHIWNSLNCTVEKCSISTGVGNNFDEQTDSIYVGFTSGSHGGHIFRENYIFIANTSAEQHLDNIQLTLEPNCKVYHNWLEQGATSYNCHVIISSGTGTEIYDNIIIGQTTAGASAEGIRLLSDATGSKIYNNTIIFPSSATNPWAVYSDATDTLVKNNIIYGLGDCVCIYMPSGITAAANVDYNFLYSAGNTRVGGNVAYNYKTWAQWQAAGFDAHGKYGDPSFTNFASKIYTLESDSLAIDVGIDLSTAYQDALNPNSIWPDAVNTLIRSGTWDIGAYEYPSGAGAKLVMVFK